MSAFKDLTGRVFGRLKVLSRIGNQNGRNLSWTCLCECGKICTPLGVNLRSGGTKSCGCLQYACEFSEAERNFRLWFSNYKSSAKIRSLEFSLAMEEFRLLVDAPCKYCGGGPKPHKGYGRLKTDPYLCNGLDRVDNTKGYTVLNCVPCCTICNLMKRGMSAENFIAHVESIALKQRGERKSETLPPLYRPSLTIAKLTSN